MVPYKIPYIPKESPLANSYWNKNKKLKKISSRNGEIHYLMPASLVTAPKESIFQKKGQEQTNKTHGRKNYNTLLHYDHPVSTSRPINSPKDLIPTMKEAAVMSTIGGVISLFPHLHAKILGGILSIPTAIYDGINVYNDPTNPLNWVHLALDVQSGISKGHWDEALTIAGIGNDATVACTGYPPEHFILNNKNKKEPYIYNKPTPNTKLPDGKYSLQQVCSRRKRRRLENGGLSDEEIERREVLRKPLDYLSFSNYH
ncbi:MAG: hypothetical protein IJ607_09560 [Bacteroidaceae bacterium]|nr:hypothetical protein [Bacteroidaceae bacterium]